MTHVTKEHFGQVPGQGAVEKWTLRSPQVAVEVLTLGCIVKSVHCKAKDGRSCDVVLGYDDLEGVVFQCLEKASLTLNLAKCEFGYASDPRYFGAVVGRVANRIAGGQFTVEGTRYQLDINNGPNALHGGLRGFNKAIWLSEAVDEGVRLTHTSPDGDQGYPGDLQVSVTYTLKGETLTAHYQARTTRTTPINLTNHSYFNLAGQGATDIYDHTVSIHADFYLPVDGTLIPTGEVRAVEATPFDLREPALIGSRLKDLPGPGFDHNFCLALPGDPWLERDTARVFHAASGRVLGVSTSQPGVQFYTANFLDGSLAGKGGARYGKHSSFCLETQNWPDAVNKASFPDSLLRPGEEYRHTTHFTFSTA